MFNLDTFYSRQEWTGLRLQIIDERSVNGVIYCEHCGKPITDLSKVIAHHIIPLTNDNVNDVSISLNPENIMLVHHSCHNEIHERFVGGKKQKIYLIYGSPCSGKSHYVNTHAKSTDLILDIDKIWECISINDRSIKPDCLKSNVFKLRDEILDMIRVRLGRWENAYIIGCYPFRSDREFFQKKFKAIPIHIDSTKELCLQRANSSRYREIVEEYWENYEEDVTVPPLSDVVKGDI